jgi:hypothetical protein
MLNYSLKYNRLTPWLLLLVFFGPWLTAHVIYAKRDQFDFKTIETGIFLSPPIQAQSLSFYDSAWLGKWQIIYMNEVNNDNKNNNVNHNTIAPILNQLHRALGKEKHRVAYQIIPAQYSSLQKTSLQHASLLAPGKIILIDPHGWLIMHYPPGSNPIDVLKDMRRLLKYSHGT